jgi:glutamate synthase domain-containing protein 3
MEAVSGMSTTLDGPASVDHPPAEPEVTTIDLHDVDVRTLNAELHAPRHRHYEVLNSQGAHAVAAGVHDEIDVHIRGHVGYYCAGMNEAARIVVDGSAGTGVAENMMSGSVRVRGDASQSAGATGRGGLLVVEGSASMRCGISMKGIDIVVGGSVGPMSAFMAQAGRLVVCGDAGDGLGDSIYEARLYVRGETGTLGADCVEKPMRDEHHAELAELLAAAGLDHPTSAFRRYGSARSLYHFTSEHADSY